MEEKKFWCKDCRKVVTGTSGQCPKCQGSSLIKVKQVFESIIKEMTTFWHQMIDSYHEVSSMAREIERLANRYIELKEQGFKGREAISSKILNFYAKLSCSVEPASAKIEGLKKDFDRFKGEKDYFLPSSAAMEKVLKFKSNLLDEIYSLQRELEDDISSLVSPKGTIGGMIQHLERKKHLLRLLKANRSLHQGERVVKIISDKDRSRFLFITSQRLLVIHSLRNKVVREVPLAKISGLELKGRLFTKKVVLCLSTQKEVEIHFNPGSLSKIRESVELGKQTERDTFTVEQKVFRPPTTQLIESICGLFREVIGWIRRERESLFMRQGEEGGEGGEGGEPGEAGEEERKSKEKEKAVRKTLAALEDSFKKGIVEPEYFFNKKLELERKNSEVGE